MNTKIVYAFVSDASDTYLEQLILSAYSARFYNCDASLIMVTDSITERAFKIGWRSSITQYFDDIIIVDTPVDYTKMQRSRYIKTNLRHYVKGDYVFLDCDTIVCHSLSELDTINEDIALVADLNGDLNLVDVHTIKRCEEAGFGGMEGFPYYNSGVMYVKDTPLAHRFYEEWYRQWRFADHHGVSLDQPALCKANEIQGFVLKELPGKWNCQVNFLGGKLADIAIVLHYAGGSNKKALQEIFEHIRQCNGSIGEELKKLINNPHKLFYTIMTITEEAYFCFAHSEMVYYYFHQPMTYRLATHLSRVISPLILFIWNIKNYVCKHSILSRA